MLTTEPATATPSSPRDHDQALIEAVQGGQTSLALELLLGGADPNQPDRYYGWTSLHVAARDGKEGLARLLLKHGAHVDARDSVGQTPLHRAAFWGKVDVVRLLLEAGADFTALDDLLQTPEELALQHHHEAAADLIRQCLVFLELSGGSAFRFPPEVIDRMREQVRTKQKDDRRRRELRHQLERQGEKASRRREKAQSKEAKLVERRHELGLELDQLKGQIAALHNVGLQYLTKRELALLKALKERLHKVQHKMDLDEMKLQKEARKSLSLVGVRDKGAAWIDFINN